MPAEDLSTPVKRETVLFLSLVVIWTLLLRLMPDGRAYSIAVIVVGLLVAIAYLRLLIDHVRKMLGGKVNLTWQIAFTVGELAILLVAFASIYQRQGIIDNTETNDIVVYDFWRSLYLSFITFTTVGYGDFYPVRSGRALAALQGLTGYLVLGILASTAASLLSPHSPEGPYDKSNEDA